MNLIRLLFDRNSNREEKCPKDKKKEGYNVLQQDKNYSRRSSILLRNFVRNFASTWYIIYGRVRMCVYAHSYVCMYECVSKECKNTTLHWTSERRNLFFPLPFLFLWVTSFPLLNFSNVCTYIHKYIHKRTIFILKKNFPYVIEAKQAIIMDLKLIEIVKWNWIDIQIKLQWHDR